MRQQQGNFGPSRLPHLMNFLVDYLSPKIKFWMSYCPAQIPSWQEEPGRRSGARMAAIVRGGHARQGRRRDRGQGRGRRGVAAAAAEPQGRVNPLGYQWLLWRAGNTNNLSTKKSRRDEDERMRIFRELEDSPRVSREELNSYGLPNGILGQRAEVIRILQSMVSKCNDMADMRRRYLWRCLHGYQGKETTCILKKLQEYQEEVALLQDDVKRERGYCPPTPHILTTDPKLH